MNNRAARIARQAHAWLSESPHHAGQDETGWVVVETEDMGMDVLYHMAREYYTQEYGTEPPEGFEIKEDTLPSYAFNPQTGRAVFVVSQPNHLPTAQTTMQKALAPAEKGNLSEKEKKWAQGLDADVQEKMIIDPDEANVQDRQVDYLLLDQEHPMWPELQEHLAEDVEVHATDRVQQPEVPEDPSKSSGSQYEPAE